MGKILLKEIEYYNYSWWDQVGRIFFWNNRIFRGIYYNQQEHVNRLFKCGLINRLVEENLFPESWITNYYTDEFPLVIEHEIISPVTFSYEWCFSMLKDAAICVLKINKISQSFGYQLKDCHGSNILFKCLNPVFIDLGSFIPLDNGDTKNWIGYEEFRRFYYYPLKIWSKND